MGSKSLRLIKSFVGRRYLSVTLLCLCNFLLPSSWAMAGTVTWTGLGGNGNWDNPSNWNSGVPVANDTLVFSGSNGLSTNNNLAANTHFKGLVFDLAASNFVLNGNALTLENGITGGNTPLQTINNNIVLASDLTIREYSNFNLNGTLSGPYGLIYKGRNTTTLTGANVFTGNTTLSTLGSTATLKLDFSSPLAPASNILYNSISPGSLVAQGGTLQLLGADSKSNTQSFSSTQVGTGKNTISLTGGSGGSVLLNLGPITKIGTDPGVLNINLPAGIQNSTNGVFTSNAISNGILTLGTGNTVVTIDNKDWAAKSGSNIVGYTGYTASNPNSLAANQNINMTDDVSLSASAIVNTLRISTPNEVYLTLNQTGNTLLTISTGCILRPLDGKINAHRISGGRITGSLNGGLNIYSFNNSGGLAIDSSIVDNGSSCYLAIYGGIGVQLSGTNTYTGKTYIIGSWAQTSNNDNLGLATAGGGIVLDAGNLTMGSVVLNNANQGGDRCIEIRNSGNLVSSGVSVITGSITGDGNLFTNGLGTIDLRGAADYSGYTSVGAAKVYFRSNFGSSINTTITNGSKAVMVPLGALAVGQSVSGFGVPPGTIIKEINQTTNTILLSAAAIYSGNSMLDFGAFTSLGKGEIRVTSTLVGAGFINGDLVLYSGGISPGDSSNWADISTPNFTWRGNGTLNFGLGANGLSDTLSIAGNFSKNTSSGNVYRFNFEQLSGYTGTGSFDLITFGSTTFSASDFTATGTVSGTFQIVGNVLRFTPNTAIPSVATPAAASQNPVITGNTASLSVLGSYVEGEAGLTYHWTTNGGPPVIFSANDSNAAKNTIATFTQPGTYNFLVNISNANGFSVTSQVSVVVNRTYSIWTAENNLLGSDALPDADPDHNGLTNLVEYAYGIVPNSGIIQGLPTGEMVGGSLAIKYIASRSDLTYQPEWSTDLVLWQTSGIEITHAGSAKTATVPVGSDIRKFLHVRLIQLP